MTPSPGAKKTRGAGLRSSRGGLLLLLCLAAALAGCAPTPRARAPREVPASGGFPVTLGDDAGREVTIPARPARIVSLAPAYTETLYALGAGQRVVMADSYSDYPPEARRKAKLNCWPAAPLEQIVALEPDLIVVFTQDEALLQPMEAAGIPALKLFPTSFEEALRTIEKLGDAVGERDAARALTASLRARALRIEQAVAGRPKTRVLYEMDATDPARPFVAGSGGLYGDLLTMAGGKNVFDDLASPAVQVSSEQVLARNPEVILLGDSRSPHSPQDVSQVARRPGWGEVAAVKGGRVHAIDSNLVTRPGPRLVEGLEEIARRLHPRLLRDEP